MKQLNQWMQVQFQLLWLRMNFHAQLFFFYVDVLCYWLLTKHAQQLSMMESQSYALRGAQLLQLASVSSIEGIRNEWGINIIKAGFSNADKEYFSETLQLDCVSATAVVLQSARFQSQSRKSVKSAAAEISLDEKAANSLTCVGHRWESTELTVWNVKVIFLYLFLSEV